MAALVPDQRVELAVGEGPRAPLAEDDVGLGVEGAPLEERRDVDRALFHRAAALEHERPVAGLREQQRGEEPGGPAADDDGTRRERLAPGARRLVAVLRRGLELPGGGAREERRGVGDLDVEQVDELDAVLAPGVHGAARDTPGEQFAVGDAEPLEQRGAHGALVVVEREADLVDPNQGPVAP